MPHLSPISWIMTLIILWSFFIILTAAFWWQQTPSLKMSLRTTPLSTPFWNWFGYSLWKQ